MGPQSSNIRKDTWLHTPPTKYQKKEGIQPKSTEGKRYTHSFMHGFGDKDEGNCPLLGYGKVAIEIYAI
jgi:hypothetical protein